MRDTGSAFRDPLLPTHTTQEPGGWSGLRSPAWTHVNVSPGSPPKSFPDPNPPRLLPAEKWDASENTHRTLLCLLNFSQFPGSRVTARAVQRSSSELFLTCVLDSVLMCHLVNAPAHNAWAIIVIRTHTHTHTHTHTRSWKKEVNAIWISLPQPGLW